MPGSLNPDSSLDLVAHVIQVALTPIFLLSGIATLLNVFATRLARVADLVAQITKAMEQADPDESADLARQLLALRRRSIALDAAIVLGAIAAAATCASVFTLFVGALRNSTVGLGVVHHVRARDRLHDQRNHGVHHGNDDGRQRSARGSGTPAILRAGLRSSPEELGASPLEIFLRSEEILAEVEGVRRPFRLETDAVLPRDIGKTVGDIRAAGEDDTFHFRSDRRQRSADIVAAVEEGWSTGRRGRPRVPRPPAP